MKTMEYAAEIVKELQLSLESIVDDPSKSLVKAILQSKKVFVAGAGRSGLMGRAFAMRLMHLGIHAYVVGETVTPGMTEEDLLIIGSGSGETKSLIAMAQKAKGIEAALAIVTLFPESTLGALADIAVTLPGSPKDQADNGYNTIQPMGSLYEQTLLFYYDAVILSLMEKLEMDSRNMYGRHANLE
jgi:6-phospho-3-hexuloisomerase